MSAKNPPYLLFLFLCFRHVFRSWRLLLELLLNVKCKEVNDVKIYFRWCYNYDMSYILLVVQNSIFNLKSFSVTELKYVMNVMNLYIHEWNKEKVLFMSTPTPPSNSRPSSRRWLSSPEIAYWIRIVVTIILTLQNLPKVVMIVRAATRARSIRWRGIIIGNLRRCFLRNIRNWNYWWKLLYREWPGSVCFLKKSKSTPIDRAPNSGVETLE